MVQASAQRVSMPAPSLRASWRVGIQQSRSGEPGLPEQVVGCLERLEALGRSAFNVYPARDDEPDPAAATVVARLHGLGATSGIGCPPPAGRMPAVELSFDRPDEDAEPLAALA
jgi:hypothetical protein